MDPKHLALLRVHDSCRGLVAYEIEAIGEELEVLHCEVGEVVHSAADPIDAVHIVVEGRLVMTMTMPNGQKRTIRYLSAGDVFGALMLLADEEIPVDVVVDEKAVIFRLQKKMAEQLAQKFPMFRRNLLRKIGVGVRDSLQWRRKRTVSKLVSILRADDRSKTVIAEIASRLARIGEKVGILSDSPDPVHEPGISVKSLRASTGTYLDSHEVHSIIEEWTDVDRIFHVGSQSFSDDRLVKIVEASDKAFCFADANDFRAAVNDLESLIKASPSSRKKTALLWVLDEVEQVVPLVPGLPELVSRDFKVQMPGSQFAGRLATQGIDRIVHSLRGVSVGVALSGGAAHGMAHLGVLKALDEAGITIDRMAGTSAGVLTGVLYSAGYSPDWGIEHFTHDLQPGSIYHWVPKGDDAYILGKYRTGGWEPMLRRYLQDWQLQQLPVPINTVTTDLIAAESVTRSSGDAVDSILESINLPVISKPICRDGKLLVDGGILNNLPADVLVNQDCNFVLGVDVGAHIEYRVGDNDAHTPTAKMKSPHALATLIRCLSVQAHNMSDVGAGTADVVVTPDVSKFESSAFTKTPEMAEIGYRATMESLPRIREVLHNLDGSLFSK